MNVNQINNFMKFADYEKKENALNSKDSFSKLLGDALNNVNKLQLDSREQKNLLAIGEMDNLHDVTIMAEKAEIALQVTMSMKNKIVEAYKEIMRIQI